MLLEADADINQATSNGSCLHEAALYGKTDVVKFLLEVSHRETVILYILYGFHSHFHPLLVSEYHSIFNFSGVSM